MLVVSHVLDFLVILTSKEHVLIKTKTYVSKTKVTGNQGIKYSILRYVLMRRKTSQKTETQPVVEDHAND